MKFLYPFCLLSAAGFLVFLHTHTDELPIVLGLVLIVSGTVGAAFPGHFPISGLVLGAMLFLAETMVHFGVLSAPYPASSGLPWVALVGYVPALIGVGLGAGARRMMTE